MDKIPDAHIQQIIELHDEGKSMGQIARIVGHSKSTIHKLYKTLGLKSLPRSSEETKANLENANKVKATWNRERRLKLNDLFFDEIKKRLKDKPQTNELKALAVTYAIMVDKREILEPAAPLTIDDGFIDALEAKANNIWNEVDKELDINKEFDIGREYASSSVQMAITECETMENSNLVVSRFSNSKP